MGLMSLSYASPRLLEIGLDPSILVFGLCIPSSRCRQDGRLSKIPYVSNFHHVNASDTSVVMGNIDATVKAIYYNKAFPPSTADIPSDALFGVILDRTSFYAEAGGQEYDTGNIVIDGAADFEVTNVQSFNGYVLHIGHLKEGQLSVGDKVVSQYDEARGLACICFAYTHRRTAPPMAIAE